MIVTVKTEASLPFSYSFRIEISRFLCVFLNCPYSPMCGSSFQPSSICACSKSVHRSHQFKNITQKSKIWRGCRPFLGGRGKISLCGQEEGCQEHRRHWSMLHAALRGDGWTNKHHNTHLMVCSSWANRQGYNWSLSLFQCLFNELANMVLTARCHLWQKLLGMLLWLGKKEERAQAEELVQGRELGGLGGEERKALPPAAVGHRRTRGLRSCLWLGS